ncbi:MAG TPA: 2'-5' RNA ligase family protein [Jatrophihabitans sp.]|nr:2'-5' RNA ligase family protein [Jatrophihabitans sp.]
MIAPDHQPLVLTLSLDPAAQARFDAERAELFPPGRTAVGAHVTLFHALPGDRLPELLGELAGTCRREPFPVRVTALASLGRGVAYRLDSAELAGLHADLQRRWWPWLTRQDRQGFRPHVTVQNKVEPAVAARTLRERAATFAPFSIEALGLRLWRYLGGPWAELHRLPFTGLPARERFRP